MAGIATAVLFGGSEARADDVTDTVMLTNGGRVRGTVMEEDPQKGTSIKLLDGTVKKLPPADVKSVVYGTTVRAAAAAPVAPPLAAAVSPAMMAPAAPGVVPALGSPYAAPYPAPYPGAYPGQFYAGYAPVRHKPGHGAVVAGLVILCIGGATAAVGGAIIGDATTQNNDGETTAGIGTVVAGAGLFAVGGLIAIIGAAVGASSSSDYGLQSSTHKVAIEPVMTGHGSGLELVF